MGYRGFDSFDEVAKKYAETIPLRGARKAQDIRPLAERRYWWQRIIKVNDNKYALEDGMWSYFHNSNELSLAPITWERRDDGDYLIVRNCPQEQYSVTRYGFLDRFLPRGMSFWFENGKHFVRYAGQDIYLAKFKIERTYTQGQAMPDIVLTEDHKLVFKHLGGDRFERVSEPLPYKTRRLDRPLLSEYRPKTKELWDWACAVLPMMGNLLGVRSEYSEKLNGSGYWYWMRNTESSLVREILNDPEHEKRLALAILVAVEAGTLEDGMFAPTDKNYASFRKVVDKVADLYAVEMK